MPLLHFSERKWDWNLSSSHREPSSFRKCVTEKSWTWTPPGGWVHPCLVCRRWSKSLGVAVFSVLQILQEQNLATEPNKESKWERNSSCLLWWMESMRDVNSDAGARRGESFVKSITKFYNAWIRQIYYRHPSIHRRRRSFLTLTICVLFPLTTASNWPNSDQLEVITLYTIWSWFRMVQYDSIVSKKTFRLDISLSRNLYLIPLSNNEKPHFLSAECL